MYSIRRLSLVVIIVCAAVTNALMALNLNLPADVQTGDPDLPEFPFKAGDAVLISTFPDTTNFLNGIFPIDDRGYTELPIVGKVKVSELRMSEFQEFLRSKFKAYLRYPDLYVKPMVRISLLGGFLKPGLYYVDINYSLWEAVNLAGGTLLEEGIYDMRWERGRDKQVKDLTRLFESGVSLRRMGFHSGDQIWTPSPARRTIWDTVRDVMPILTFATTIWIVYNTYQRDLVLLRYRAR